MFTLYRKVFWPARKLVISLLFTYGTLSTASVVRAAPLSKVMRLAMCVGQVFCRSEPNVFYFAVYVFGTASKPSMQFCVNMALVVEIGIHSVPLLLCGYSLKSSELQISGYSACSNRAVK